MKLVMFLFLSTVIACAHPAPPKKPASLPPLRSLMDGTQITHHLLWPEYKPASCMEPLPDVALPAWPENHDPVGSMIIDAGFRDQMDAAVSRMQAYMQRQYVRCADPEAKNAPEGPTIIDDPLMPEVPVLVLPDPPTPW